MKIRLRYGRGFLELPLPPSCRASLIEKPPMPLVKDPARAVAEALDFPLGTPPLEQLARPAASACIAVCDITRPVPNHLFLRPLIERLWAGGVPRDRVVIVVATGLHRPNWGDELAELIGDPWVLDNVRVVNHDARDDASHVDLGVTPTRGVAVRLDRRFVEADLRIVTGLVEPHFMAGYSGGRKVIAPGLAHAETITTFHNARFMSDPAATSCNLRGNPLHEEQLQILHRVGGALAVNTVIDDQRRLALINFGEAEASHQRAVDFARRYCEAPVPRRFRTVVTSAAGHPLDKTYYQTIKGVVSAAEALAPGGDLLIASACEEGLGSDEFREAQQRLIESGPDAFLEGLLRQSHARVDEWQTQMLLKPLAGGRIGLFSEGLSEEEHRWTGVERIESLSAAIEDSVRRQGDADIAVIPEGPYVVARPR